MSISPSYKQFADYFLMGLKLNICSKAEVIIWSDNLIEEIDYSSSWMINLSTSQGKSHKDIISTLNSIPGKQDSEVSFRLLIAKLALVKPTLILQNNKFFSAEDSKLFSKLYFLIAKYTDMPDDIRKGVADIYLNMDDVEQGYLSSLVVQQDYQTLLATGNNYQIFVAEQR